MTRIAFITSYPFPDAAATANRVKALVRALAAEGAFGVSLICPGPSSTAGLEDELALGYEVINEPERSYARTNLLLRAWRELAHMRRLFRAARNRSPDFVVVTVPSIFLLCAVWYFPRGRVIVDLRDLAWEYLASNRGIKGIVGRVLTALAQYCLRRSALVSVTNDAARERLGSAGIDSFVVRNGIAASQFERMGGLAERGPPAGVPAITYVGNVGLAQELDTLVLALGGVPGVKVVVVGAGSDLPRLQRLAREKGFENVVFTGPKPWTEVLAYYSDAHILYGQIGRAFETAVPSKLFEYLATGRRVVFGTPPGDARTILEEFDGVSVVDPGDQAAVAVAVQAILREDDFAPRASNRELVREKYLREPQAREFVRRVKERVLDERR